MHLWVCIHVGYSGDVWDEQPPSKDHPWKKMPNQAMTPHTSGTTLDAQVCPIPFPSTPPPPFVPPFPTPHTHVFQVPPLMPGLLQVRLDFFSTLCPFVLSSTAHSPLISQCSYVTAQLCIDLACYGGQSTGQLLKSFSPAELHIHLHKVGCHFVVCKRIAGPLEYSKHHCCMLPVCS